MHLSKNELVIRSVTPDDIHEMCELLNEIIDVGGTTANETPFTEEEFEQHYLSAKNLLCCFVAVDKENTIAGFQTMGLHPKLPENWSDIATFARIKPKVPGVGTALFERTKSFAEQAGIVAINATIRADNKGGLAYYKKMGFEKYLENKAKLLNDGTPVDRVSKRYVVA